MSEKTKKSVLTKKTNKTSKTVVTDDSDELTPVRTPCCGCICVCSNQKTIDHDYCFCAPIKCGIIFIGVVALLFATYIISYNLMLLLNEHIDWWFPIVWLILFGPFIIGTTFFVVFFTKDKTSNRNKLPYACLLMVISLTICCIWTCIYYVALYKPKVIYVGSNGDYESQRKLTFV